MNNKGMVQLRRRLKQIGIDRLFVKRLDFRGAALHTSQSVVITDALSPGNPITFVNPAFTILTGYSEQEVVGRPWSYLRGADTDLATIEDIQAAMDQGASVRRELWCYRKDGSRFWNDITFDPIRDRNGTVTGFIGILYDATPKLAALDARRELETRLSVIADNLPGFLFERMLRPDGHAEYRYVSSGVTRLIGLPMSNGLEDGIILDWVPEEDFVRCEEMLRQSALDMKPIVTEFRLRAVASSGVERWFRASSSPRALPGGAIVWSGVALDISAEKLSQFRAEYLTSYDSLTGLLNRPLFRVSLVQTISTVSLSNEQTALFHIDLDEFQGVNDSLGPLAGDRVLRRVGITLMEFAEARGGIASRLGGDEFAVMLPGVAPGTPIQELAERIRANLAEPIRLDGQEVTVASCVGAAVFPRLSDTSQAAAGEEWAAELMKRAQVALYAAKREASGVCRVYSPELDDRFRHRQALRQSLQRGINEQQFVLHYQPVVDLETGGIVGVEALLRWNHPEFGVQRPDLFIPIAETSSLIIPLGAWVVRAAMRQRMLWAARGLMVPRVCINVSSVQMRRPGFLAMIEQALADTGADPRDFELELTESTLLEGNVDTRGQLAELKAMGFTLAIDDFGTGHSTFKYLRDFPVDKIKIDQTFVRQLVVNSNDVPIVRAMMTLAHSLRIEVVAEGVETAMQRDFLAEEGCQYGQGYFFSMPLTAEDLEWMIENKVRLPIKPCPRPTANAA
jgi:diguanylate cyclase (GGDEF)-like protein/PAS domain S-box-containing protein